MQRRLDKLAKEQQQNWKHQLKQRIFKARIEYYETRANMSKEMDWDNFVPTGEIREYDRKFRESIRQREQLKLELAELEKRKRSIFWDVEYAMLSTGIKYFDACSEYWLHKLESEYIKAEIASERSLE